MLSLLSFRLNLLMSVSIYNTCSLVFIQNDIIILDYLIKSYRYNIELNIIIQVCAYNKNIYISMNGQFEKRIFPPLLFRKIHILE